MLKRISVKHLRKGMYVRELCGSWMEHPFWRTSFPIVKDKDLQQLLESSITEVWIDTVVGLDADYGQTREEVDEAVAQRFKQSFISGGPIATVSMQEELQHAAALCAKAKQAVAAMFGEARAGQPLELDQALPMVEEISGSLIRHSGALISFVRLKAPNEYGYMHSIAVCALMTALARQLNLDPEQIIQAGLAGLLHDIGKARVPERILDKPEKLTDEEFRLMKSHPEMGYNILAESEGVGQIAPDVCLHHHEKIDGSGYPHRLTGEKISLFAKMAAVCDVYDAITSSRPYKEGLDPAEALRKMAEWGNGHFDERIFQSFVKVMGIYPIGSLVRLESGRLGVVVEQNPAFLLLPRVRVFFSAQTGNLIQPELVDLAQVKDPITRRESAGKWKFNNLDQLWAGDVLRLHRVPNNFIGKAPLDGAAPGLQT